MPNTHETLVSLFEDIADAIREKTGSADSITADNFPTAISEIPSGGGDNPLVVDTRVAPTVDNLGKFAVDSTTGKMYRVLQGDDGTWHNVETTGLNTSITYNSIAYGNGKFVTVGSKNKVYYSTDGITWTAASTQLSGTTQSLNTVIYANGLFVVTGSNGYAYYSTNGTYFTYMSGLNDRDGFYALYDGTKFVAIGVGQSLSISTNGTTWSDKTHSSMGLNIIGFTYGDGKYVCCGTYCQIAYSSDLVTWTTKRLEEINSCLYGIAYGNGKFVCVGENGKSFYSTDGDSWTAMSGLNTSTNYSSVTYANGKFVCVGNNGKSYYSTNGTSWTAMSGLNNAINYNGVSFCNGSLYAVSNGAVAKTVPANVYYFEPLHYDTQGIPIVPPTPPQPTGYKVTITADYDYLGGDDGFTIKVNAPVAEGDWDYGTCYAQGIGQGTGYSLYGTNTIIQKANNAAGYVTVSQPLVLENVSKLYMEGYGTNNATFDVNGETFTLSSNEVTITQDTTIVLHIAYD